MDAEVIVYDNFFACLEPGLPMDWTITFYSGKVEKDTLDLPPGILASLLLPKRLLQTAQKRKKEVQTNE